ncbi:MAG: LTA synthase family protein [Crocinitomicaceae bacterium]|nr:LTA synthase family protein [Crocinitomicaceae bacterium]
MNNNYLHLLKQLVVRIALLFLFWILLFDFQRIIFTLHNFDKFSQVGIAQWLGAFFYSLRLDMAAAGYLCALPVLFLIIATIWKKKWAMTLFSVLLIFEALIASMIHAGEVNAYPEWNHKLTGRVFMHLSHPDEVVRTADWGMTIWFSIYVLLDMLFVFFIKKKMFRFEPAKSPNGVWMKATYSLLFIPLSLGMNFLLARGGLQQIPINTDAAIFSNNYAVNDLSVNSVYFFGKSYLLYNRTNIDEFIPHVTKEQALLTQKALYDYSLEHDNYILANQRPNIVFVVMESWTANAIGSLSDVETATPNFDKLAQEGLLFTNLYGVASTSEIGNSAIFSGYPGIPEISITMQQEKSRKIPCLNQDLKAWGYTSGYLFSGDLKYGNIGSYFTDHGFDKVEDENDFPKNLERGKLNYYDEDLYKELIIRMNKLPQPFLQCGFTGSTHSPYDFPNSSKYNRFSGVEGKFQNSLLYADECLNDFIQNAKKESWYKNTLFVFIADHGHASNLQQNPSESAFNRIPCLIYGEPLKQAYRGKRIDKLGSQVDIVRTLLYQLGGDYQRYKWSVDLLNPNAPEFALHAIIRGYGWVRPTGNFTYLMENKIFIENKFPEDIFKPELQNCHSLLSLIYEEFKQL